MSGLAHQHLVAAAAAPRGTNAAPQATSMPRLRSRSGNDDSSSSDSSQSDENDGETDAAGEEEDRHAAASSSSNTTIARRSGRGQAAGNKRSHSNMNGEETGKNAKSSKRHKANGTKRLSVPALDTWEVTEYTSGKAERVAAEIKAANEEERADEAYSDALDKKSKSYDLFGVIQQKGRIYTLVWCGHDPNTRKAYGHTDVEGKTLIGKFHLDSWADFKRRTGRTKRSFQELLEEYP